MMCLRSWIFSTAVAPMASLGTCSSAEGDDGQTQWLPVYEGLALPAIEQGNGRGDGRLGPALRRMLGLALPQLPTPPTPPSF